MTVKAAIDIGTNSILILVAEIKDQKIMSLFQDLSETRLGRGISRTGKISRESLDRTISAVKEFYSIAGDAGADEIYLYGTEVFRKASNGIECARKIGDAVNAEMKILSPQEEAFLAFHGVGSGLESTVKKIVLDVGGGSFETVVGAEKPINWASLPIGAVNISEDLDCIPPFDEKKSRSIIKAIQRKLDFPFKISPANAVLLGAGGTITTLCAIKIGLNEYCGRLVNGKKISKSWIREIFLFFGEKRPCEIADFIPFSPERADIIAAGTAIYLAFMELFGFEDITVSDRGSRWGILIDNAISNKKTMT